MYVVLSGHDLAAAVNEILVVEHDSLPALHEVNLWHQCGHVVVRGSEVRSSLSCDAPSPADVRAVVVVPQVPVYPEVLIHGSVGDIAVLVPEQDASPDVLVVNQLDSHVTDHEALNVLSADTLVVEVDSLCAMQEIRLGWSRVADR